MERFAAWFCLASGSVIMVICAIRILHHRAPGGAELTNGPMLLLLGVSILPRLSMSRARRWFAVASGLLGHVGLVLPAFG